MPDHHQHRLTAPADIDPGRDHDLVVVVDHGREQAQSIARRVREAGVLSEIIPHTAPPEAVIARRPKAIILSAGSESACRGHAQQLDTDFFAHDIPVLAVGYSFQMMMSALGGTVADTGSAEHGHTALRVTAPGQLLNGVVDGTNVRMHHDGAVASAPDGFQVLASTAGSSVAACEDSARGLAGVQWLPDLQHDQIGSHLLANFLFRIAGCRPDWTPDRIVDESVAAIRAQVGDQRVLCALSGGVDSAVAAALVQRAVGHQLTCVFVDHGLLRKGEPAQVERDFVAATGVDLKVIDAQDRFLSALAGVTDPEQKRKVVGAEFIDCFDRAAAEIIDAGPDTAQFLVQGTLYPDVVESGSNGAANIKSHHNVGGLPQNLQFQLVEPLRMLFKDEVRAVGEQLGLPGDMVWRQPFPGPGLGVRVVGEITRERLDTLREADAIVQDEVRAAGLERDIWQFPVVLLADVRSVGVQREGRSYGYPIVLRPVTSQDAMTADWFRLPDQVLERISSRIIDAVPEVNRVVLDITSKPPGTIEWE